MRTRGEGVKKAEKFAYVLNGSPLTEKTDTFRASEALVWKNGAVARILLSCNLVWTLEDNIISYSAALLRRKARHAPRDLENSCLVLYCSRPRALGSPGESAERAEKMHDCGARKIDDLNNIL